MLAIPRCLIAKVLCVSLVLGLAAGCGTVDRDSAKALSSEGSSFATTTATAAIASRDQLDRYVEGQYLVAAIADQQRNPPSADMLQSIDRVASACEARTEMLKQLGAVYASFGKLASYDASTEVESSVDGLTGSINAFAKAIGEKNAPISGPAAKIASGGGGLIAEYAQSRRIKKASALIRQRLASARDLLSKEQAYLVAIREELIKGRSNTAIELWRNSVGLPHPILREQLGDLGLTYDEKQTVMVVNGTASTGFTKGITAILQQRTARQVAAQSSIMADTISGFNDLIAAHNELEAGEQLTLQTLTTRIAQLRGYLEQIEKVQSQK